MAVGLGIKVRHINGWGTAGIVGQKNNRKMRMRGWGIVEHIMAMYRVFNTGLN